MSSENRIFEYIRDRKGNRIGVIVGFVKNGQIVTGFSQVNRKLGDVFDVDYGLSLAINRALGINESPDLPSGVVSQMEAFKVRCMRYFQQAKTLSVNGAYVPSTGKSSCQCGNQCGKKIESGIYSDLEKELVNFLQAIIGNVIV